MLKEDRPFDIRFSSFLWVLLGFALLVVAEYIFYSIPEFEIGNLFRSYRAITLTVYILVVIPFWFVGWKHVLKNRTLPFFLALKTLSNKVSSFSLAFRWLAAILLAFLPAWFMLFSPFRFDQFPGLFRFVFLIFTALAISFILYPRAKFPVYLKCTFSSLLAVAAIYAVGIRSLTITAYPFSLAWSEGNRIWDYSILFGSDRYVFTENENIFALIERGRQFIWGIPFLFPRINILVVRLWDAIVSVFPHFLLAVLLAAVVGKNQALDRQTKLELGLLALLFLSQGPVFPNLIFPAIIMVVGLSNKNTLVSVLLVALAAYIASIDRFHWGFGLPALAALFSGLKQERLESSIWKSLQQPAIVVSAGLIGALAFNRWRILPGLVRNSQNYSAPIFFGIAVVFILIFLLYRYSALRLRRWVNYGIAFGVLFLFITTGYQLLIYIPNSGSLQQELLWFRWLPNPTFPPGILLALLLATGPAILLLFIAYRRNHWRLNKIQIVVTSSVCLTLLAVGLVASAKIGGGGDLHNLDLFLLAILFAASVGWPHIQKLKEDWKEQPRLLLATYLLLAAPVFYLCFFVPAGPLKLPPPAEIESALETIQESVAQAQTKGEILFMDQRQLLTFGYVENVPLVDDYEKKRVMDEALSANASYFRDFYSDLENHRFSLIVSEILFIRTGNLENPFPEENDAWVYWVAEPMLDYYMPLITLRSVGVQLLVPRSR